MTPGMFRRGRTAQLLSWLLIPPTVVALVYCPFRVYSVHLNRELDQRGAVLEQVPEMVRQVRRGREMLRRFPSLARLSGDISTEFTVLLNHAAREHGFTVRSVAIEKGDAGAKSGVSSFRIVLQGDGTLASMIKLFHALDNLDYIFVVDGARLGVVELTPGGRYSAEIVLKCHVLST